MHSGAAGFTKAFCPAPGLARAALLVLLALPLAAAPAVAQSPSPPGNEPSNPAPAPDDSGGLPGMETADDGTPVEDGGDEAALAEFAASLHYRTGDIVIGDGLATIHTGPDLRYLDPEDTQRVLEDVWGNPDAGGSLGMLVPYDANPTAPDAWGVIITYAEDGHVADTDAADLTPGPLLARMQAVAAAGNEERRAAGLGDLSIIGFADPPRYDAAGHKLSWAKEIAFEDDAEHTVNYNLRILGRTGVLELNAVGNMTQLPRIRERVPAILAAVDFNPGRGYGDFVPGSDPRAPYGLAMLVTGEQPAEAVRTSPAPPAAGPGVNLRANGPWMVAAFLLGAGLTWLVLRRRR